MRYNYDFHIHSCLSPCGDNDMTPCNIVNMAKLTGLDVIALTDHNSCENCEAAVRAGQETGLTVIPGMELCTAEEIHVVCLFPDIEKAVDFSGYVQSTVPKIKNRPDIFGEQRITDENDNIISYQELLLTTASGISINDAVDVVKNYGGVCFPAHIDRSSYSVISNLGAITEDMNFNTYEITEKADEDFYREKFPIIKGMKSVTNSDAHYLEQLCKPLHSIELTELSAVAVINYFA